MDQIELGKTCCVIREYRLKNQVIDIEIVNNENSSYLVILYNDRKSTEIAGNNIIIFDKNFKEIFEVKGTQYHYTSISKWISSSELDVINIALIVMMSKRIHLMTINTSQV